MTARLRRVLAALALVLVLAVLGTPASPSAYAGVGPAPGRWPLDPRPEVVQRFDPPAQRWDSGHRGVDLAGRVGQPVHAALAGQVTFAGRIAGVGVVVVDHGETRTTYQPVTPAVARGDRVAAGQVLGTLSFVGTHCLPRACLHWGWVRGSIYLDPLLLVGGPRPVRLLPFSAGGSVDPGGAAAMPGPGNPIDKAAPKAPRQVTGMPRAGAAAAGAAVAPVLGPALSAVLGVLGDR